MKLKAFTIYDTKLEAYMQPFFMAAKGQALRAFSDTVNDASTQFNKHPQDFTLFEIGEYDDSSGQLTSLKTPLSLGVAIEFVNSSKVQQIGLSQ